MGEFGPYDLYAGVVERRPNFFDLQLRNQPGITGWRLWGAAKFKDLYGNPLNSGVGGNPNGRKMMFEVASGQAFRSSTIAARRITLDESFRGSARALFDLKDFDTLFLGTATGTVTFNAVGDGDTVVIGGVTFTGAAAGEDIPNKKFDVGAGDNAAATSLAAVVNDAANQGDIAAANGGVSATGVANAAIVTLTATVAGPTGDLTLATDNGATVTFSGATLLETNIRPLPSDNKVLYLAVQPRKQTTGLMVVQGANNTGSPIMGPILIVPSSSFWVLQQPAIVFAGDAPSNTGCVFGEPPVFDPDMQTPPPLQFVFPRPASGFTLRNIDTNNRNLLFSFGLGMPMTRLAPGESSHIDEEVKTQLKTLVLAREGNGGACTFSVETMIPLDGG